MNKLLLYFMVSIIYTNVFAVNNASSSAVSNNIANSTIVKTLPQQQAIQPPVGNLPQQANALNPASGSNNITQTINTPNLGSVDIEANDIHKIKRKVELEKYQADLKKLRNPTSVNNGSNNTTPPDNAQTTVTGVAINEDGRKIAWLQFADGGSLMVNIGSRIGKYTVSDITMTGVKLSYATGGKHSKTSSIFLKRAYYAPEKSKNQALNQRGNSFFAPSPIVTGANTNNSINEMVPPIISDK